MKLHDATIVSLSEVRPAGRSPSEQAFLLWLQSPKEPDRDQTEGIVGRPSELDKRAEPGASGSSPAIEGGIQVDRVGTVRRVRYNLD